MRSAAQPTVGGYCWLSVLQRRAEGKGCRKHTGATPWPDPEPDRGSGRECHLKGLPISRREDQPGDGGRNVFFLDVFDRRLLSGWRRIKV